MTPGIMPLDVLKLRRLPEGRDIPIQAPDPAMQRRVSRPDIPQIALEMLHVHGVEADDGRVQAHVRFGDVRAEVVGSRGGGEVFFDAVERGEECRYGFFVGFLRSVVSL